MIPFVPGITRPAVTTGTGGCRVLTFEPQAAYASLIQSSIYLNGLHNYVHVLHAGAGAQHGKVQYDNIYGLRLIS
jgi:hypothetical protein